MLTYNNLLYENFKSFELKPQIKNPIKNVNKDKIFTANTINLFQSHHTQDYTSVFQKVKPFLHDLRRHDEMIKLENQVILKHTYLILFQIWQYMQMLDYYNSEEYSESFAGLKSDKRKFLQKYRKFRKEIFSIESEVPGAKRIKAAIFKVYARNREFSDIFLNFYTIYPIHQFKNDNEILEKIIEKIWIYFASTPVHSEQVIYKSLAITLNAYFRLRMNINSRFSVNMTRNIIYELFRHDLKASSSDLLHQVYIGGRIAGRPVFKNRAKGDIYSPEVIEQYNHFFNKVLPKEFPELDFKSLPTDAKEILEEFPLTAYFNLYPREFLRPKV